MRDIDSTVDFVKDLLKNDSSARASPSIDLPGTFSAQRGAGGKQPKDASVYKHDDSRATGYKSSARHLDRKQVRYEGEDKDEELGSIRRDLENSSKVLDRTAAGFAERTEEDERLEQELDDLKYRVRRVKDDIEYVSRGKRSDDKDEERRKLERELLYLMHDRLPEVEKKIEEREERKRQEARDGIRARDKRNETYGRYRDRDDDRGDYGRRDRYEDDRYRRGSRETSRERRGSRGEYDSYSSRRPISPPPRDRTPPATPAVPRDAVHSPPPAPAVPTSVRAAVPSTKSMTPEERTAFIRQQAQERLAARMRALGMAAPEDTPSSSVDSSVEERLAREKKEAEEKAKQAEKQQEEREAARKARLQQAGGGAPETSAAPEAPSSAAPPTPLKSALKKAPAPPPPKPRTAPSSSAVPKAAPPAPAAPKEDPADAELRAQEQAHQKAMEERRARLKRMQEEEEEAERAEEALRKRREALQKAETPVSTPPVTTSSPAPAAAGSTNPFHRMGGGASSAASPPPAAPPAPSGGGFNPFFRPPPSQQSTGTPKSASPAPAEAEAAPPPPPPPAPAPPVFSSSSSPAPFSRPQPAKAALAADDDEWDVIDEKDNDSDSSDDDDYAGSRKQREAIARSLFGGAGSRDTSKPASPAPVANKAALSKLGGGNPSDRGNLLSAIKMGAGLRKAVTNDRSASSVTGKVVGDAAPPPHISLTPQEPEARAEPQQDDSDQQQKATNRQSVDWYSGLAADAGPQAIAEPSPMPSVAEDEEPPIDLPGQNVSASADNDDELAEFDMATSTSKDRSDW